MRWPLASGILTRSWTPSAPTCGPAATPISPDYPVQNRYRSAYQCRAKPYRTAAVDGIRRLLDHGQEVHQPQRAVPLEDPPPWPRQHRGPPWPPQWQFPPAATQSVGSRRDHTDGRVGRSRPTLGLGPRPGRTKSHDQTSSAEDCRRPCRPPPSRSDCGSLMPPSLLSAVSQRSAFAPASRDQRNHRAIPHDARRARLQFWRVEQDGA
jgi:hypothetical protein